MTIDTLIAAASESRWLSPQEVDAFCSRETLTGDAFARKIAVGYSAGEFTFSFSDSAINALCGFGTDRFARKLTAYHLAPYAWSVFFAFDEGGYWHQRDSRDLTPEERYTKPLIAKIIATHTSA